MWGRSFLLRFGLEFVLVLVASFFSACGGKYEWRTEFLVADARGLGPLSGRNLTGALPADLLGVERSRSTQGGEAIEREIAEADLWQLDGDHLWLLNPYRGLAVVDLAQMTLLARLQLPGLPREMHRRGERLFVCLGTDDGNTRVAEIDTHVAEAPALVTVASLRGVHRTSRIVGDVLVVVTDGVVASFRLTDPLFAVARELALPDAVEVAQFGGSFSFLASTTSEGGTRIRIADLSDPGSALVLRGSFGLPGMVATDLQMDLSGDVLRVVTHDLLERGISHLTTIDVADPDAPHALATLTFGHGEQLMGARFDGSRAYMVTFEQIDPLWIIDLSDPRRPRIAGELQVPGYSTQLVPVGDRVIALGVVPEQGFQTVVSLFDVADAAHPALLDREPVEGFAAFALGDRMAMRVLSDRVLVPTDCGLSVFDLARDELTHRGAIAVDGGAQRGLLRGTEFVAQGMQQVVVADATSLDVRGRVTVAEDVVDVERLADGRRLELVQIGDFLRCGGVELEMWGESLFVHGLRAAIVGWSPLGREVVIVDYSTDPPTLGPRFEIGWGGLASPELPRAATGPGRPGGENGMLASGAVGHATGFYLGVLDGVAEGIAPTGQLVLRGIPTGDPLVLGSGEVTDGLVIVDLAHARLARGILVRDAAITGLSIGADSISLTWGRFAGADRDRRPLLMNRLVTVDLVSGVAGEQRDVQGQLVARDDERIYVVRERWRGAWDVERSVVALLPVEGRFEIGSELTLPDGAWGCSASGHTLVFTTMGDPIAWFGMLQGALQGVGVHSVRLGATLEFGPSVGGDEAFRSVLLVEDGDVLVSRNGAAVERFGLTGTTAVLDFSRDVGSMPLRVHADRMVPGRYLGALGFGGAIEMP